MTCRHSQELLAAFLEGDLDAATRDRLDVHLAGCTNCSEELFALRQVDRLLKNASSIRCPDGIWETLNQRMAQAPPARTLPRSHGQLAPAWSLAVAATLLAFTWNPQQAGRYFVVHSDSQPAAIHPSVPASAISHPFMGTNQANVGASVAPSVAAKPVVEPRRQALPISQPAVDVKRPETLAVIPSADAPVSTFAPPARGVIVNQSPAQSAPVSPEVQAVVRPVVRAVSSRILLHGTWNPSLAALRNVPPTADVQSARSMAGVEAVAPADDSFAPPSEPAGSNTLVATPVTAADVPSAPPVEEAAVQGTVAVAAQTASSDTAALEQARKDMYGMSLEAEGTTLTASLPTSAGA